jgi:hypothetical protein
MTHATKSLARAARRTALLAFAAAAAAAAAAGCYSYNLTDPNGPTLSSLINNPTQAKLSAAATGIFESSRADMQQFVWRVGSMGREGINLSGNNQPDYQEPYFGPLSSSEFGSELWFHEYTAIRNANNYIDAVPKAADLAAGDRAASIGFAETIKALEFMYIIETRANLGAPVDVDRPITAVPAPFVTEDSVYGYALGLLDSARANLRAAGSTFPFPVPPGYASFNTPQTWRQYTWALTAKAEALRATASKSCGAPCYGLALTALDSSFISAAPASFASGAYFDFGTGSGERGDTLSEPLNGPIYFALAQNDSDAQLQPGGAPDQRVVNKIAPIPAGQPPQILGGIPIQGTLKFTVYFIGGSPTPAAPIPVIKDEELILLRAEAEIGTGNLGAAVSDLNLVRQNSGLLAAYGGPVTVPALITELLYNRRYSLLWEQGTRWIDARRFGLLSTIPPAVPGGHVPTRMPIPADECNARGFGKINACSPLGT